VIFSKTPESRYSFTNDINLNHQSRVFPKL